MLTRKNGRIQWAKATLTDLESEERWASQAYGACVVGTSEYKYVTRVRSEINKRKRKGQTQVCPHPPNQIVRMVCA